MFSDRTVLDPTKPRAQRVVGTETAAVHGLDNAYVYNIDDLKALVDESLARRRSEIGAAELLVERLAGEFYEWVAAVLEGRSVPLRHSIDQPDAS